MSFKVTIHCDHKNRCGTTLNIGFKSNGWEIEEYITEAVEKNGWGEYGSGHFCPECNKDIIGEGV